MTTYRRYLILLFFTLTLSNHITAAKVKEVKILDQEYLIVHLMDGEVTFADFGTGESAFQSHGHLAGYCNTIRFGQGLNTEEAAKTNNWVISSADDANYLMGKSPVTSYRKSKLNGMAELEWVDTDFAYDYTLEHFIYLKLPFALQSGKSYTLSISPATNSLDSLANFSFDVTRSVSEAIHINLVGYPSRNSIKSADLYHWMGNGNSRDYSSFVGNTVSLYNTETENSIPVGAVTFWKNNSGDVNNYNLTGSDVWNIDFTGVTTPGTYRLVVEGIGCSNPFEIRDDIYFEPFRVSTLGFFYMRIGQDNPEMTPVPRRPLFWPNQSPENCKVLITDMDPYHPQWGTFSSGDVWDKPNDWIPFVKAGNPENNRAIGGHSDALDWDRHLGHVAIIYDMLLPYVLTDGALADDQLGIAESGNGIPDIIDEARNEVDFWLNLRYGQGYSHGLTNPNDQNVLYQADNTPMAAWANALNSAMLGYCFQIAGIDSLSYTYRDSAIAAYNYANNLPDKQLDIVLSSGYAFMRGRDLMMMAAAYLYNLTGDSQYEEVVNTESIVTSGTSEVANGSKNQLWGLAAYLYTKQTVNYPTLQANMKAAIIYQAKQNEANLAATRPSRRSTDNIGGYFHTIQDVQRAIIAHSVAEGADKALLEDALLLEADWGLGRNPLNIIQMTTATTRLAHHRSIENLYSTGRNDGAPGMHPGHTPYLNTDDWAPGMVMGRPSWMTSKGHPDYSLWPRAEAYYPTRFVWAHGEFTPQQTMRGKMALYGYLYGIGAMRTPPAGFRVKTYAVNGTVIADPVKELYQANDSITLTATAKDGYTFAGWSVLDNRLDNPLTIRVYGDQEITANFTTTKYSLSLSATNGNIVTNPGKTYYYKNDTVQLQAVPDAGYRFSHWSIGHSGSANPAQVIMNSSKIVKANFVPDVTKTPGEARPDRVEVFPNPTSGLVTLKLPENQTIADVFIYNTAGSLVKSLAIKDNKTYIDLSEFKGTICYIKVRVDNIDTSHALSIN